MWSDKGIWSRRISVSLTPSWVLFLQFLGIVVRIIVQPTRNIGLFCPFASLSDLSCLHTVVKSSRSAGLYGINTCSKLGCFWSSYRFCEDTFERLKWNRFSSFVPKLWTMIRSRLSKFWFGGSTRLNNFRTMDSRLKVIYIHLCHIPKMFLMLPYIACVDRTSSYGGCLAPQYLDDRRYLPLGLVANLLDLGDRMLID